MPKVSLIAAVDENFGLGKDNRLLCHLPADLSYFKTLTLGKTILMGRKTFESIGKPLPKRFNIVLSKQPPPSSFQRFPLSQVNWVSSLEEAFKLSLNDEEILIIGGESIYRQTINIATKIYLTKIHHQFDADTFFPPLESRAWTCSRAQFREKDEKNNYSMTFFEFERVIF